METIWNIQEDVENKKYGANLAEKIKLLLRRRSYLPQLWDEKCTVQFQLYALRWSDKLQITFKWFGLFFSCLTNYFGMGGKCRNKKQTESDGR